MSSAQEHLSVICAKFLRLQVAQEGVKIVPKALSGAIARHSGDGKFYAMPHNEALVGGLSSGTSFQARPWKWPAQVLGRFGYSGLMGA